MLASTTGAEPTTHFSDDQLSAAEQSVLENRVHIQLHPNHEKMRQEREMSVSLRSEFADICRDWWIVNKYIIL